MRFIFKIFLCLIFLIFYTKIFGIASSNYNIITENNEFKGKTIEIKYDITNNIESLYKRVIFYNNLNDVMKEVLEYYKNSKLGVVRRILYYTNKILGQDNIFNYIYKEELFFSEEFSAGGKFYNYEVNFLDENGRKYKTVRLYPEWYVDMHKVSREEIIYNKNEKVKFVRFYNKDNKLINVKYY